MQRVTHQNSWLLSINDLIFLNWDCDWLNAKKKGTCIIIFLKIVWQQRKRTPRYLWKSTTFLYSSTALPFFKPPIVSFTERQKERVGKVLYSSVTNFASKEKKPRTSLLKTTTKLNLIARLINYTWTYFVSFRVNKHSTLLQARP